MASSKQASILLSVACAAGTHAMCTVRAVTNFGLHVDGPRRPSSTWTDDNIYVTGTKEDPRRHADVETMNWPLLYISIYCIFPSPFYFPTFILQLRFLLSFQITMMIHSYMKLLKLLLA